MIQEDQKNHSAVPSRNAYYSERPINYGDRMVESFTGYLERLAGAHHVTVSDMICDGRFDHLFPHGLDRRARRRLFLASCHLLDGSHTHTRRWVTAIELATCQVGLRFLTLEPFVGLAEGSWVRKCRAWCDWCLKEWIETAPRRLYTPLLWSVRLVLVCPFHEAPLTMICLWCNAAVLPLAGQSVAGHCGRCGNALWLHDKGSSTGKPAEHDYQSWCAKEILSLIGALQEFRIPLIRSATAVALRPYLSAVSETNITEIARAAGCTRRSVSLWSEGSALPRIESLLRLCFRLGIAPLDFAREAYKASSFALVERDDINGDTAPAALHRTMPSVTREIDEGSPLKRGLRNKPQLFSFHGRLDIVDAAPEKKKQTAPATEVPQRKKRGGGRPSHRRPEVTFALKSAIQKEPPPTLSEVAKSLGCTNSSSLRRLVPDLCDALIKVRASWRLGELANTAARIRSAILQTKLLPFKAFCLQFKIVTSQVDRHFPELKTLYRMRYQELRQIARNERRERFEKAVHCAVATICSRDEFPSADRVVAENRRLRSGGWHQIQRSIRKALESRAQS